MTYEEVLKNLRKLVGKAIPETEFYNEIIIAFDNYEECEETDVYVGESENNGYDYIAYIAAVDSTPFYFSVDKIEDNKESSYNEENNYIYKINSVW